MCAPNVKILQGLVEFQLIERAQTCSFQYLDSTNFHSKLKALKSKLRQRGGGGGGNGRHRRV